MIVKLRILPQETRPDFRAFWGRAFWGNDGIVSHEDAKNCIRLLGKAVFPAIREMAKEFDLKTPFETSQPVSIRYIIPDDTCVDRHACRVGRTGETLFRRGGA